MYVIVYIIHVQVLACAPSNIAVDNIVERLHQQKVKVRIYITIYTYVLLVSLRLYEYDILDSILNT